MRILKNFITRIESELYKDSADAIFDNIKKLKESEKSEQDMLAQTIEMFKKEGLTDKQISQVLGIPYYGDFESSKEKTENQVSFLSFLTKYLLFL